MIFLITNDIEYLFIHSHEVTFLGNTYLWFLSSIFFWIVYHFEIVLYSGYPSFLGYIYCKYLTLICVSVGHAVS